MFRAQRSLFPRSGRRPLSNSSSHRQAEFSCAFASFQFVDHELCELISIRQDTCVMGDAPTFTGMDTSFHTYVCARLKLVVFVALEYGCTSFRASLRCTQRMWRMRSKVKRVLRGTHYMISEFVSTHRLVHVFAKFFSGCV